jgi:isoleucyl-tRNA synthetase
MFKPVSSRVNFPEMEENILKWWHDYSIFEESVNARRDKPRFVFYEGPPFANGNPGIHHVLARVFKDVIVRYRTMKGYYVPRIAGWDTHGLPVELEIEKQLGVSSKKQIEDYGVEEFNRRCRESVFKYLKEWNTLTERIAYWVDLDKAYMTMNNDYIESVWWAMKQLWDKDLIYQGYRVTPHCPRCGTSLSSHEVAQGYQDNVEDPSIFIKFKLVLSSLTGTEGRDCIKTVLADGKPAYLLAWTTTPWTLPANTALAVSAASEYVMVQHNDEYIILAGARQDAAGLSDAPVVARVEGKDLAGLKYEPLFNPADFGVSVTVMTEPPTERKDRVDSYPVIAEDFVSMEDGTGIVHVAPAYGEVDYDAGKKNRLYFVHSVDLQGKVIGTYPFAGKFIKTADPFVLDDLKSRGLLFRSEKTRHTYPFCWRCGTPLVYYAKQSWYIRTTAVKKNMIDGNKEINWYPDYIKDGRFGDWLQNNVDWAFSRERYWGTPLPIWRCEKCGSLECVGGVAELKAKPGFNGLREPLDLHRPYLDEVTFACSKCGGAMHRTPEVLDCWFDSGSMPFAQLHYPFQEKDLFDGKMKQADFICEAVDQTRGWFYSLHAISTMLFNRPSFKNVICLGLILDAKGEKMSKSHGNVVSPTQIINKYGADALRWYLYTASPPGNARRFDEKQVLEVTRRFLLTLWNTYSFFVTYANIDRYQPGTSVDEKNLTELDRWVLSELHQLVKEVDSGLDTYDPTEAGRKIEAFIDRLSNWYIRRNRRRFWKSGSDSDKLAAYNTLYECLLTVSKLLAPFTPFVADELYRNLVAGTGAAGSSALPQSVHLADFPVFDEAKIDTNLSTDIRLAMDLSSLGRAARSQAGIKVRQPLPEIHFGFKSVGPALDASFRKIESQLLDELNVKQVKWGPSEHVAGMEAEGCITLADGGIVCAVSKHIPESLKDEGMAREIVHRVQTMRRSAGFEIADHIFLYYEGDDYLKGVMTNTTLSDYIKQEILADDLVPGIPAEGVYSETFKLEGHEVKLGVMRV